MKSKTVKWGILSCAWIADERTIPGILKAENAELYAIAGKTREKLDNFKKKFNFEAVYDNYDDLLLDPNVDAVYIPLPNSLHCEWAVKAAQNKKHILCEKPLAMNAEEVVAIRDACKENNVLFMEAFASRHNPALLKAKEILNSGRIGDLRFIEAHFCINLDDKSNIRYVKDLGGGATYDTGAYTLGTIRYLAGSEPLDMATMSLMDDECGVDVKNCTILKFKDGVMASSVCGFDSNFWSGYNIIGSKGRLEAPMDFNASGELELILTLGDDDKEVIPLVVPHNYKLEIEQFGRCILYGETPLVSFEDSLGNAALTDRILEQM